MRKNKKKNILTINSQRKRAKKLQMNNLISNKSVKTLKKQIIGIIKSLKIKIKIKNQKLISQEKLKIN